MVKTYKIHPAIGIARVGMSEDGYFLAPETTGGKRIEINGMGGEAPFRGYKDAAKLVRRQGVRFRIFEYEHDAANGKETLVREITQADARIEWQVELASRKAAGVVMQTNGMDEDGARIVIPGTGFRNNAPPGFTRADLAAVVQLKAEGANYIPSSAPMGKILGNPHYIGEGRTDAEGRLIVLGGMGKSASWGSPPPALINFLNNPGWYDDIADGPVDARVTLNGSGDVHEAVGAWVVTAPPDFAPDITPITTLYDVALQAFYGETQPVVSYTMDIEPIFQRAASYRWVNEAGGDVLWPAIADYLESPEKLRDNAPAAALHRQEVLDAVLEAQAVLADFRMTRRQRRSLERWVAGDFIPGEDRSRPMLSPGEVLDEAALARGVGGGFFPGIEAGLLLRNATVYSELCRLTRGDFTDFGNVTARLGAGSLTERMACPWQADFVECQGAWWPAQRPDFSRYAEDGAARRQEWDRGVRVGNGANPISRRGMVDHFAQLGVVEEIEVAGKIVQAEIGRDKSLDTGV